MSAMAGTEIEFEFYNHQTNETVILHGVVDGLETHIEAVLNASFPGNLTTTPSTAPYDGTGALWFVVAVILVYSLSMFMIIVTLARRKSEHKNMDLEVDRYIKGLETARQRAREESVLRMRLRWPGNFIWLRFTNRPDRDLSKDKEPSDLEEASSESSGSYIELPATTISHNGEAAIAPVSVHGKDRSTTNQRVPQRPRSSPLESRRRGAVFVNADDVVLPVSTRPIMDTIDESEANSLEHMSHIPDGGSDSSSVNDWNMSSTQKTHPERSAHERRSLWGSQRSAAVHSSLFKSDKHIGDNNGVKRDSGLGGLVLPTRPSSWHPSETSVQGSVPVGRDSAATCLLQPGTTGATADADSWKRKPMYLSSDAFYDQYVLSQQKEALLVPNWGRNITLDSSCSAGDSNSDHVI